MLWFPGVTENSCFQGLCGLDSQASFFEVQRFVFTAGEFSRDLDVVLAIRLGSQRCVLQFFSMGSRSSLQLDQQSN